MKWIEEKFCICNVVFFKKNREKHLQISLSLFQAPDNPENQNFKKKTPGDIIILYICTINDNYMMYDSWDMEHD